MAFQRTHTVEGGIERVVYTPAERRFATPILMQHGMYHGAWCWRHWQELFAELGWETHAHSLPGHAASPAQRPVRWCTLGYYLRFLRAEVERLPRRPVLIGHSMGGALAQWYFRHVGGDLPAAVLVAPWPLRTILPKEIVRWMRLDLRGLLLMWLTLSATPMIRTPARAAKMFVTEGALYTQDALHARLGPESGWVMLQHNPPLWRPASPAQVSAPLLWLVGERDALIGVEAERASAAHYAAEFVVAPGAGHNLMMERNYRETAMLIHDWLVAQGVP
ncbi:MAG: lysophospholipase [Anaerolineae bacterium]|nr:lysophospholipase [Anaerolineae bacterium]